jgi:gliding motility-associated-like protein
MDSVSILPSSCANNGSIAIYASSSTSAIYAIVAGPDIRPAQSGNTFSGLPSGNYSLLVTNFSNDTAKRNFSISGNYIFPDFSPTFANPLCTGTATGIVAINPMMNYGNPPFSYTLTPQSGGAVITQQSDTFYNIPAGAYTIRMTDVCQSFATRSVTLFDPNTAFNISYLNNRMVGCDTADITVYLNIPGGVLSGPLYVQVQTTTRTFYDTIQIYPYTNYFEFIEHISGVHYGDYVNITVANACGDVAMQQDRFSPFIFPNINFNQITDSCAIKLVGYMGSNNASLNEYPTSLHTPLTVVIKNGTSSALVDSFVIEDPNGTIFGISTKKMTGDEQYIITVTDTCGNMYSQPYYWPLPPAPALDIGISALGCRDSTASVQFTTTSFLSTPRLTILSGPSSISSSKPYFAYRDTIIYPMQYDTPNCYTTGTGGLSGLCYTIGNLGVGTYQYRVVDSCGTLFNGTFTVLPKDVLSYGYSSSFKKGCPGENRIQYSSTGFDNGAVNILIYDINGGLVKFSVELNDTLYNLNPGTYIVQFMPLSSSLSLVAGLNCFIRYDTIVIPPYEQPQIDYAVQIKCNGLVNVGLQPDSNKGVPPYQYEIVSGPQTNPLQSSNFFTFSQQGTYVARISDTCGFARTFTFSVDTLSFRQVIKVGSSCLGDSVLLILQPSPYSTYRWERPNGSFYTGDTLSVKPVSTADYGTYRIAKYVQVNNCTDTFITTYVLSSGGSLDTFASICSGQSITFGGQTYSHTGSYNDTITTAGCNRIITLHLTVGNAKRDTIRRYLCTGDSINFGGSAYKLSGNYRDTFATNGCDSISVLMLKVSNPTAGTINQNICPGQSYILGSNTYGQSGTYHDTLYNSNGCDSIVTLNLTVSNVLHDTISQSICAGQNYTFGGNTYSQAGVYRDTLTTTGGCDSVLLLNLTVNNMLRDTINQSICAGQNYTFGGNTYSQTGVYRDTFTSAGGCDSMVVLALTVNDAIRDTIVRNICFGQSVMIGANTYNQSGIYTDTFAAHACDSIVTLQLTVAGIKKDTVLRTICPGESIVFGGGTITRPGIYTDTIATAGCDSFAVMILSFANQKRDSASLILCYGDSTIWQGGNIKQSGAYHDTIATAGCDSIFTLYVTVQPPLQTGIVADNQDIKKGETVQLNTKGGNAITYLWQPDSLFTNSTIQNPLATIAQSIWISLLAENANGCKSSDSIYISVHEDTIPCNGGNVYVPNTFSPNSDGLNDIFYIYGRNVELIELQIFNRWGELVFESHDLEYGWDGYFRGQEQPPGVFVYFMKYFACDGYRAKVLKGSLNLLK